MKILFYLLIISAVAFSGCSKSSSDSFPYGRWQLAKEDWGLGSNGGVRIPAADSSVTLTLSRNGNYGTTLNGKIVSQGKFSFITDGYSSDKLLELFDFKPTGILSSFATSLFDANGQILSPIDGFYITVTVNTMTLRSGLTPGGFTSYTFVRNIGGK